MKVHYEEIKDKPKRYHAIKCLDCRRILGSKQEAVKSHKGHAVHYVNEAGEVDE